MQPFIVSASERLPITTPINECSIDIRFSPHCLDAFTTPSTSIPTAWLKAEGVSLMAEI
jgi:hypothetical protein